MDMYLIEIMLWHRIRLLSIEPYTQEEANRAAGMGSYVAAKKLHIDPRILPAAAVAATATAETSVETVTETSNMSWRVAGTNVVTRYAHTTICQMFGYIKRSST